MFKWRIKMMRYVLKAQHEELPDFKERLTYIVAAVTGLKTDRAKEKIAQELVWGGFYRRNPRQIGSTGRKVPGVTIEHFTGCDEYHLTIGLNGTSPESHKTFADRLVTATLSQYLTQDHQANL